MKCPICGSDASVCSHSGKEMFYFQAEKIKKLEGELRAFRALSVLIKPKKKTTKKKSYTYKQMKDLRGIF